MQYHGPNKNTFLAALAKALEVSDPSDLAMRDSVKKSRETQWVAVRLGQAKRARWVKTC